MKDHEIAQVINTVKNIAIEFKDTRQLRERIAGVLRPILLDITRLERVNKEWEALWKPIDELVRPLTPLGESVGGNAVELITSAMKREPAFWYSPTAKNSVISNASKRTKGTTHLYADWSVPLYD